MERSLQSDNRCTTFPRASELFSAFTFENSPLPTTADSGSRAKSASPKLLHKRTKPPRIPLPVKRPSDGPDVELKRQTSFICNGPPWEKYQKLTRDSTSGKTCLAYEKSSPSTIVAIKRGSNNAQDSVKHLIRTSHTNVVNLLFVFTEPNTIYEVYERMEMSLEQLHSSVRLKEPQIAFVCKEVLHGLLYIHLELHISHGDVKCSNTFLTAAGSVKIGNIARSLFSQSKADESRDTKSVGIIVKEIMEPGDAQKNPGTVVLKKPGSWNENIRAFLSATQVSSLRDLLNVGSPVIPYPRILADLYF